MGASIYLIILILNKNCMKMFICRFSVRNVKVKCQNSSKEKNFFLLLKPFIGIFFLLCMILVFKRKIGYSVHILIKYFFKTNQERFLAQFLVYFRTYLISEIIFFTGINRLHEQRLFVSYLQFELSKSKARRVISCTYHVCMCLHSTKTLVVLTFT